MIHIYIYNFLLIIY